MTKNQIIKLITFPIVLVLTVLMLALLFFVPPYQTSVYGMFYKEEKNSLNVVLLGNSTVKDGVIPVNLWKEYNITSYLITSAPTHPEVIKVALRDVMTLQNPQVVYIDVVGFTYQTEEQVPLFLEKYLKAMPDGEYKKQLCCEYGYNYNDYKITKNIFENHNTWRMSNPLARFFEPVSFTKGYTKSNKVTPITNLVEPDFSQVRSLSEYAQRTLTDILQFCKNYPNTHFLFGRMPRFYEAGEVTEQAIILNSSAKPLIESYVLT